MKHIFFLKPPITLAKYARVISHGAQTREIILAVHVLHLLHAAKRRGFCTIMLWCSPWAESAGSCKDFVFPNLPSLSGKSILLRLNHCSLARSNSSRFNVGYTVLSQFNSSTQAFLFQLTQLIILMAALICHPSLASRRYQCCCDWLTVAWFLRFRTHFWCRIALKPLDSNTTFSRGVFFRRKRNACKKSSYHGAHGWLRVI